jgi:hypothetical protein
VRRAIQGMRLQGATEVVLEAETHNAGALAMYEGLGFIRDKRLERSVASRVEDCCFKGLGFKADQKFNIFLMDDGVLVFMVHESHGPNADDVQCLCRGMCWTLEVLDVVICCHAVAQRVACCAQVLPERHGRLPAEAAAAGAAGGSRETGSTGGGGC